MKDTYALDVTKINKVCAAGEIYGRKCKKEGNIPVFSCEGGCIKGEIARQTANIVAQSDGFARACHGELFTVPHADLSKWIREADRVVVIDGCGLSCHGRIAENIIDNDKLVLFNTIAIHGRYKDLMNIDEVPAEERMQTAQETADAILASLNNDITCCPDQSVDCGCGESIQVASGCCDQ